MKAALLSWIAIGAAGIPIVLSLLGSCLLIPVIGWFLGIPLVLMGATIAGGLWGMVLILLFILSLLSRG